jgi:hypothetical protein
MEKAKRPSKKGAQNIKFNDGDIVRHKYSLAPAASI